MDIAVVVQRQLESRRAGRDVHDRPGLGRDDRLVIEGAFGLGNRSSPAAVSPDRYVVDKTTLEGRRARHPPQGARDRAARPTPAPRRASSCRGGPRPALADVEVQALVDLAPDRGAITPRPRTPSGRSTRRASPWILQSRPITATGGQAPAEQAPGEAPGPAARPRCRARAARSGPVRVVAESAGRGAPLNEGEVLVAHMTAPDWVPLMRRAAAIVTDPAGRHATLRSSPASCSGSRASSARARAPATLRDGEVVTVDAGRGLVYEGR